MSRKLEWSQYEEIKQIIGDFVEDYDLPYPIDPFAVLRILRVDIVMHHGDFTGRGLGVHTRDGYTSVAWSDHGPCFTVHLNADMPTNRQRFTLAHEIGHILLDHFLSSCMLTLEQQEGAANYFASYLLAPVVRVLALPEITVASVSDTFMLSSEAAKHAHNRALRVLNRPPVQTLYDRQLAAASHRLMPGAHGFASGI